MWVTRSMDALAIRVARQFLARVGGPQVTINGRKYTLSDYWPGMTELVEGLGAGGAKIIGPPEHEDPVSGMLAKFKYLWAYDTDRMEVDMWRYTDGNHKVYGKAGQLRRELLHLQQKGQLNHVTTDEMRNLERWARGKQDEEYRSLKQWVEENKSEIERRVEKIVQDWFDRALLPKIEAGWEKVRRGWRPPGFEVRESLLEFKDEQQQAMMAVVDDVMTNDFSQRKVNEHVEDEFGGLDVNEAAGDSQLTYWVRGDVMERFYDRHPI